MKKMLTALLLVAMVSSNVQAYTFSYRNSTPQTIYFEPFAWGVTENFSFFKGDQNSRDGWSYKGAQMLQAGEQKTYDFRGIWCHGKIEIGTQRNNLKEVPMFKANREQYNELISNLTKVGIAGTAGPTALFAGPFLAAVQLARLFENTLCQNYAFIIAQKDDGSFFITATPW